MYRLDGGHELPEKILKQFGATKNRNPCASATPRASNCNWTFMANCSTRFLFTTSMASQSLMILDEPDDACGMGLQKLEKPDDGIWEVRGVARPFLHSRAMCWLAIDRAMQIARRRSFPAPLVRWHKIRDDIYKKYL